MFRLFIIAMINSVFNTLGNAAWRYQFSRQALDVSSISAIIRTCFQFYVFVGVFFYGLSMLIFFYLLSNYKMSSVVPLSAMNYIFNLLVAHLLLKEQISIVQIGGMLLIILGIIVYSRGVTQL